MSRFNVLTCGRSWGVALKSGFLYLEEHGKPAQEQTVSSLEGWVRFSAKTVGYRKGQEHPRQIRVEL